MTALRIPDLDGKAVLITGASTGIGAALARAFAAQGALAAVTAQAQIATTKAGEALGRALRTRAARSA